MMTAAGGLAAAALVPPARPVARPAVAVFVDPALDPSRTFGRAFSRTPVIFGADDSVRLWNAMPFVPAAVAGISRWADYVMIRELAGENGLRVRHEARHDHMAHHLRIGDATMVPILAAADRRWPAALARMLGGTPGGVTGNGPSPTGSLFSWWIG